MYSEKINLLGKILLFVLKNIYTLCSLLTAEEKLL